MQQNYFTDRLVHVWDAPGKRTNLLSLNSALLLQTRWWMC